MTDGDNPHLVTMPFAFCVFLCSTDPFPCGCLHHALFVLTGSSVVRLVPCGSGSIPAAASFPFPLSLPLLLEPRRSSFFILLLLPRLEFSLLVECRSATLRSRRVTTRLLAARPRRRRSAAVTAAAFAPRRLVAAVVVVVAAATSFRIE